ncbi:ThiF family adenylyltransferase [Algoriphagus zhangzhouensis]|uniref:Molybdopterin-synthase adenylyltransferase n=1 Tax=Algoriphagus zhangzhouensis TaxID=1073327 RepID=A0A1M7ZAA0_9BACT|nr:ThiF family adenylyltransferase [Algoriphagus zhangzhouensis]TDY47195.1 adenylyltransferase/sulfurtransferase [Algoriphagus zhangzhouensis]SHO61845.1 adenylyltransferase and sulfurtransferase [Algoriphagus zhangzhouensis]
MDRYLRQITLPQVGNAGQEKLLKSKVLVIGAGGLGCAVLPYLVAAGIGEVGIVDGDRIEESNLHRQVLYASDKVGNSKAKESAAILQQNNPTIKIQVFEEYLTQKNVAEIISGYDLIIDATDNFFVRYTINDTCVALDKPFIYGSIYQFQGQVSVFNYKGGPTYRDIFPEKDQKVPNCEEAGVMGTTVGLIGMIQANEAIKILLEIGEVLSGKLLLYDLLRNEQQVFEFSKVAAPKKPEIEPDFELLSAEEVLQSQKVLLDVREFGEEPEIKHGKHVQIPLSKLDQDWESLKSEQSILVFCQSGIRARRAAKLLFEKGFQNLSLMTGGAKDLEYLQNHEENLS